MVGYSVMSLLMTAAPLAMKEHDHGFSSTAFVIQWHVLGMFLPSFVTGHLIARLGVLRIILAGAVLAAASVVAALSGAVVGNFLVSLFLLGVGWNFMFVGATTLLTESYRPIERAKTQAVNDFLVFGSAALASLSAGALQNSFSWSAVNIGVIPLLGLLLASLGWLVYRRGTGTRPGPLTAPESGS
jgi:MFS family permease